MRSRPVLHVGYLPREPVAGEPLEIRVAIEAMSRTPIDGIDFVLVGQEGWRGMEHGGTREIARMATRSSATVLAPGVHHHRVAFDLPSQLPPTFSGVAIFVRYLLEIRVSIPWWPDRRGVYEIPVRGQSTAAPGSTPIVLSTDPAVASTEDHPQMEASLDNTQLAPGDLMSGAFALGNLNGRAIWQVRGRLEVMERHPGGEAPVRRLEYHLHGAAPPDGQQIPFRIAIPDDWPASFRGQSVSRQSALVLRAELLQGRDVTVPIPLAISEKSASEGGAPPVPSVGTDRLRVLWETCAAQVGLAFEDTLFRITGDIGGVHLKIGFADADHHRGPLQAVLQWPFLGIQLQTMPFARRGAARAMEIGAVDRRLPGAASSHFELALRRSFLTARFREQLAALLDAQVRGALACFQGVELDDGGALIEGPASGGKFDGLMAFVDAVRELARAIDASRQRVPPPSTMVKFLPAWESFASETGGWLERGRMWIHDAILGRDRFELGTRWEGEVAEATVLWIPLDRTLAAPPSPVELAKRSPASAAAMRRLGAAVALRIGPEALEAELPAPLDDPRSAAPLLRALGELAGDLDGGPGGGPYR